MYKRDISLYIVDIFIAIDKIKRYTKNFNSADIFKWSELEWDATIRELEIIGEATNSLIKNNFLANKEYRKIVDFRNILAHEYFGIDEEEVWDVITYKLDNLHQNLIQLTIENKISLNKAIDYAKKEYKQNQNTLNFLTKLEKQLEK